MTLDGWRSVVGDLWRHFFVYPSGLTMLVFAAVLVLLGRSRSGLTVRLPRSLLLPALLGPLVAVAFLPLPQVGEIRAPLDLPTWWLLLETPLLLALLVAWHHDDAARIWAANMFAALLTAWPLAGLILALLGWSTRSVLLETLKTPLPSPWTWSIPVLWAATLIPWLGLGPWRAALAGPWAWALALRQAGHLLGLVLVCFSLWPAPEAEPWQALRADGRVPALLIVLLLLGWVAVLQRWPRPTAVQLWGRVLWLAGAGIGGLFVWVSVARLLTR